MINELSQCHSDNALKECQDRSNASSGRIPCDLSHEPPDKERSLSEDIIPMPGDRM